MLNYINISNYSIFKLHCAIIIVGDIMINSYKLSRDVYITIDDIYYGGSSEILYLEEGLEDFSKYFSAGALTLTDVLTYELNKFSKKLGTMGKYELSREEYGNILRNTIDSVAYRQFGFLSVNSIKGYLNRFSDKRRIKLNISIRRDFSSEKQFLDFISKALENDHPIILQLGQKTKALDLENFIVITGYEDGILTVASKGEKFEIALHSLFHYDDREFGALYIEVDA